MAELEHSGPRQPTILDADDLMALAACHASPRASWGTHRASCLLTQASSAELRRSPSRVCVADLPGGATGAGAPQALLGQRHRFLQANKVWRMMGRRAQDLHSLGAAAQLANDAAGCVAATWNAQASPC